MKDSANLISFPDSFFSLLTHVRHTSGKIHFNLMLQLAQPKHLVVKSQEPLKLFTAWFLLVPEGARA